MSTKKIIKYIHLILSLPAGIIITLICSTGFFMIFDEIFEFRSERWDNFNMYMMRLHRWLLLSDRPLGRTIVGISTIFFIIILISGIVLWWPKKRVKLRNYFRIKRSANFTRKLMDMHRVLGIYIVLMLLLLSLTGLMWSFPIYRKSVASVITPKWVPERVAEKRVKNKKTGEIKTYDFREAKPETKLMRWVYLLHTGRWGGPIGPILTAIAALIGASLPITGYWIFFKRITR